jgi:hypothetical protein
MVEHGGHPATVELGYNDHDLRIESGQSRVKVEERVRRRLPAGRRAGRQLFGGGGHVRVSGAPALVVEDIDEGRQGRRRCASGRAQLLGPRQALVEAAGSAAGSSHHDRLSVWSRNQRG